MRIYIVEDDLSVINILEDIILYLIPFGKVTFNPSEKSAATAAESRQTLPTFCGQSLMLSSSTFSCR